MNNCVKYIDEGHVERASRVIREECRYIANPRLETLLAHGYKPLAADPQPETGEGEHLDPRYEERADIVVQHWAVVSDEPSDEGGGDE